MIIEAKHFEEVSRQFGATTENIRAAKSFIELAIQKRFDLIELDTIAVTTDTEYRPWIRVKARKASIRVIAEQYREGDEIITLLHAVIPRDAHTYEVVEKLWRKYRSKA